MAQPGGGGGPPFGSPGGGGGVPRIGGGGGIPLFMPGGGGGGGGGIPPHGSGGGGGGGTPPDDSGGGAGGGGAGDFAVRCGEDGAMTLNPGIPLFCRAGDNCDSEPIFIFPTASLSWSAWWQEQQQASTDLEVPNCSATTFSRRFLPASSTCSLSSFLSNSDARKTSFSIVSQMASLTGADVSMRKRCCRIAKNGIAWPVSHTCYNGK